MVGIKIRHWYYFLFYPIKIKSYTRKPTIGPKTVIMLVALIGGFERF
jgi:hypothetical protein